MATPTTLYKYMGSDTLEKILSNNSLKISRPSEFNDPFDSSFPGYSGKINVLGDLEKIFSYYLSGDDVSTGKLRGYLRDTNKNKEFNRVMLDAIEDLRSGWDKYIDNYEILCLSKNKNNILMWSHYARYHTGAVLGFDFSEEDFYSEIDKVKYDSKNELINNLVKKGVSFMTRYLKGQTLDFNSAMDELFAMMDRDDISAQMVLYAIQNLSPSFFIKKHIWAYEEEFRIVRFSKKEGGGFLTFKPDSVKEIIFGINMASDEKERVVNLLSSQNYPAKIFQAKKVNSDLFFENISHQIMK